MKLKTNIFYISLLLLAIALLSGCTSQNPIALDTDSSAKDETTGVVTDEPNDDPGSSDFQQPDDPQNESADTADTPESIEQPEESSGEDTEEPFTSESTESTYYVEQTSTPTPVYTPPVVTPQPEVQPTYIDGILVVNKTYALPSTYAPGYNAEAYSSLMTMFADAKTEGYTYWIASGYRSYYDQYVIYNNYVAWDGQAAADRYSARAGHSEHQTGLAFDLNYLTQAFGSSPEGIWLAQNCHKYGFIIRYPQDKESITGYMYEPWHVRYLGIEKATAVYESGLCLEEYLGITSSYS